MRTLMLALVLAMTVPAAAKHRETQPRPQRLEDFDDEVVEAPTHGPGGEVVSGRKGVPSPSLIRVRQDFRREMLRSADAI
jgi:hypothetical protein